MILSNHPEVTKDLNVLTKAMFRFGLEFCSFVRNTQLIGLFIIFKVIPAQLSHYSSFIQKL